KRIWTNCAKQGLRSRWFSAIPEWSSRSNFSCRRSLRERDKDNRDADDGENRYRKVERAQFHTLSEPGRAMNVRPAPGRRAKTNSVIRIQQTSKLSRSHGWCERSGRPRA